MFKRMRKGAVPDVVQKDGRSSIGAFLLIHLHPLDPQGMNSLVHEVHGPDGMMKTGMQGTRIDHFGKSQLADAPQTLKPGVLDQVKQEFVANGDEAVNRVVEYFSAIKRGMPHRCINFV